MWGVNIALLPAAAGSVYFFGLRSLFLILACVISCLASEAVILKLRKKPLTVGDGSAVVTGLLLALNLPPLVPLWMAVVGSVFAMGIVKHAFGGLGCNIFNPALAARVFLLLAYTNVMTTGWEAPTGGSLSVPAVPVAVQESREAVDAISRATPLGAVGKAEELLADADTAPAVREAVEARLETLYSSSSLRGLLVGNVGGCIGETSVLLLLAGAVFLLVKRWISWHTPVGFLGSLALLSWILWKPGVSEPFQGQPLFHVLSGGAVIGAFFMATDMVTTPLTRKGKLFFGIGCGVLTALIRLYAGYPEGVSFAILLMNTTTLLLNRASQPRVLGTGRRASR